MKAVVLDGQEALAQPSINNIVAYPYSSNFVLNNGQVDVHLSLLSRLSIDGASLLWKAHSDASLIIVGETPFGSDNSPNTAELMADRAEASGVDPNAIVCVSRLNDGRKLSNTFLQTDAISEYFLRQFPFRATDSIFVGLAYHLPRLIKTARKHSNLEPAKYVTAESLRHAIGDHSYDKYEAVMAELGDYERLIRAWSIFDRHGNVLNRLFPDSVRIVDVIEDLDGKLELENTWVHDKLRRLINKHPMPYAWPNIG